MTRQLLKVYGVDDTDEACNGAEAIAKVQMAMSAGQSFDGILMDSSMRVMGGPEATQLIRELGYTGKIYGVTGDADETSLAEFLGRGADRIIPKPMTKDSLCLILGGNQYSDPLILSLLKLITPPLRRTCCTNRGAARSVSCPQNLYPP